MIVCILLYGLYSHPGNIVVLEKEATGFYSQAPVFLDTIFFEDFEGESLWWTFLDLTGQEGGINDSVIREGHDTVYWHLDTMNAFQGDSSLWCGRYAPDDWEQEYGYGNGWVQHAITPFIDLTSVPAGDTVLLIYWQYYSVESPGYSWWEEFDGWDGINLWVSTDSGKTWKILHPDTLRWPGTGYNFIRSYAWYINAPWDECWKNCGIYVPGWGGTSEAWSECGFDLTPYAGNVIMIRFSFLSDPSISDEDEGPYGGWWMDSIQVVEISSLDTTVLFYEDFEDGDDGWTYECKKAKGNLWHLTENDYSSPTHCLVCSDSTETYITCGVMNLAVSPFIDLTRVSPASPCSIYLDAKFDFSDWGDGECGGTDGYEIWISSDSGKTWKMVEGYIWVLPSYDWYRIGYEISQEYIGKVVQVGILVGTDPDEIYPSPMYVDNVVVLGELEDVFPPPEEILLVDDDAGAFDVNGINWEEYWKSVLAASGYRYNVIHTDVEGVPDSLYLLRHGAVIWTVGGDTSSPLENAEINAILGYLRHGGRLWLSGQGIFTAGMDSVLLSFLHVDSFVENAECDTVIGDTLPPFQGLEAPLEFSHLNGNGYGWDGTDLVYPDTHAFVAFRKKGRDPIGIACEGNYRVVVTAFLPEAIVSPDTLLSDQALKDTFVIRVLKFLEPGIPAPGNVSVEDSAVGMVVSWDPVFSSEGIGAYRVYRGGRKPGPFDLLEEVPGSCTVWVDTSAPYDTLLFWTVTAVGLSGEESYYAEAVPGIHSSGSSSVEREKKMVVISPNPFHNSVVFLIPGDGRETKVVIYNILGRKVKTVFSGVLGKGVHRFTWDGTADNGEEVAPGIYFLKIEGREEEVYKLLMVR